MRCEADICGKMFRRRNEMNRSQSVNKIVYVS